MFNKLFGGGDKTFRPTKKITEQDQRFALKQKLDATLGSGNLRAAVKVPDGEDTDEWLAVNTVDFYNQITMLYGTVSEHCTQQSCPVMCASPSFEYYWQDGPKDKPRKVSAPEYVNLLLNWVQEQLDDESLFPSQMGVPFPKHFRQTLKTIFKRLLRVYAHIYWSHWNTIESLGEEPHLNTCFKHFVYFVKEFDLVDAKQFEPVQEYVDRLIPAQ
eukprot:GFYU01001801.1.p1 GENE.GFYU01001801.1~~GFYU01001801.1.p1  ORF type:complete len:226 (+),score=50.87 GFYU01001801.1:36-680(+)